MLTEDQLRRIEENRRLALEKLAKRQKLAEVSKPDAAFDIMGGPPNAPTPSMSPQSIHPFFSQAPQPPQIQLPNQKSFKKSLVLELFDRNNFSLTDLPHLTSIYKSFIEFKYLAKERVFIAPLRLYDLVIEKFSPHCAVEKIPEPVIELFTHGKVARKRQVFELVERSGFSYDLSLLDEALRDVLLPFQLAAVHWALDRQGRILLADDMGLGKTLSALAIACFYRKEWPLLIVVPASLVAAWEAALEKWVPTEKRLDIIYASSKQLNEQAAVRVMSYDMAVKHADYLKRKGCGVMIVDESHYLKNPSTKRCQAMVPLMRQATRLILLSGTPAMSRPLELYTQISTLCPLLFSKLTDFGIRYCDGKKNAYFGGWEFKGNTHSRELQVILENTIVLRRLKSEVLQQLPPKRREQVFLHLESSDHKHLKGLSSAIIRERISEDSWSSNAIYMKYYLETGKKKVNAVIQYLEDILEKDGKMLIFAHHKEVMSPLEDFLFQKKIQHIRIDGSTASQDRQTRCTTFQTDLRCRVALLSITAAGVGLTLTAADRVIFTELFWNPGVLLQAEDRAHRIGQAKAYVQVSYLLAKDSFDDMLWPMLIKKLNVLESVGLMKKGDFSLHDNKEDSKRGGLGTFMK